MVTSDSVGHVHSVEARRLPLLSGVRGILFGWSFKLLLLTSALALLGTLVPTVRGQVSIQPSALADGLESPINDDAALSTLFSLSELPNHPNLLFQPYLAGPVLTGSNSDRLERIQEFRALLDLFAERQGTDDNFTIRLVDERTGDVLEIYELVADRKAYEESGEADWAAIDRKRAAAQRRLVEKHARRVSRQHITVKWGRANQVREARHREAPHIEYELALASYLDLSLLATEIGTVETFNQDHLVSPAGARGRYQFMPFLIRQHDLRQYTLPTAAGNRISVIEEQHPLLMMEPAFLTLRGYVNAVGHEVPGLSAYHAGPGNIYKIFRDYLARERDEITPGVSVLDAFVWGLTDGFPIVSQGSSFGNYSRGYVPSLYGSLRAVQDLSVDTSQTMLAELVRLKPGRSVYLTDVLHTLSPVRMNLVLRDPNRGMYAIFREMNPHMHLPESDGATPPRGNIRLTSRSGGDPVRFFLPLGATSILKAAGLDLFDPVETVRYSHDTYLHTTTEKTEWDYAYEDLVRDIAYFGFTHKNRERLDGLVARFEELAEASPTRFRRHQLTIIRTHQRLWHSEPWERLAAAVSAADLPPAPRDAAPVQEPREPPRPTRTSQQPQPVDVGSAPRPADLPEPAAPSAQDKMLKW